MRFIGFTVPEALEGRSVSSILRGELRLSSSLTARLKQAPGALLRNGLPVRTNARVRAGDVVSAAVGESPAETGRLPLPFPALYEDEDILVIDKPAGAAVHGSQYDEAVPSIETAVNGYYGKPGLFHPVNRLDRGTTGVMAVAKNGWMHELLMSKLHTGDFERSYLGVCEGIFVEKTGRIDLPIARVEGSAIKRGVSPLGAPAVTDYEVVSEHVRADGRTLSLVRFRLGTGRTHQIRVHSAAVGHPLAGDWLYGTEEKELIARPALHSARLRFTHPLTGERIVIESALPEDMKRIMN